MVKHIQVSLGPNSMIPIANMESAILELFGTIRKTVMIPNVSWGIGLSHETDMVIARKDKTLIEIEIKRSASDIRADLKKKVGHIEGPISQLYFYVPDKLSNHPDIPEYAGIITYSFVKHYGRVPAYRGVARVIRPAKKFKTAVPLTDKQYEHLLHLGIMKLWKAKHKLRNAEREIKRYKKMSEADAHNQAPCTGSLAAE